MPTVRPRPLTKTGRVRKRRRVASTATRIKYQKPSAGNQKRQILANARTIQRIRASLPPPLWTDYHRRFTCYGIASVSDNNISQSVQGFTLTDFSTWIPTMRQSLIVESKSQTTVKKMSMNIRYSLNAAYWSQVTVFIVTPRKDYVNKDPLPQGSLQAGSDYILNLDEMNPRLSPACWKVHYSRSVTMAKGTFLSPPNELGGEQVTSQTSSTWKKGQVLMNMNMKVRVPITNRPWRQLPFDSLGYWQRYYALVFITQGTGPGANVETLTDVQFDVWNTCVNSA